VENSVATGPPCLRPPAGIGEASDRSSGCLSRCQAKRWPCEGHDPGNRSNWRSTGQWAGGALQRTAATGRNLGACVPGTVQNGGRCLWHLPRTGSSADGSVPFPCAALSFAVVVPHPPASAESAALLIGAGLSGCSASGAGLNTFRARWPPTAFLYPTARIGWPSRRSPGGLPRSEFNSDETLSLVIRQRS